VHISDYTARSFGTVHISDYTARSLGTVHISDYIFILLNCY